MHETFKNFRQFRKKLIHWYWLQNTKTQRKFSGCMEVKIEYNSTQIVLK